MDLMAFDGGMGNAIGSLLGMGQVLYLHGEGLRAIGLDGLADRVDKFGTNIPALSTTSSSRRRIRRSASETRSMRS